MALLNFLYKDESIANSLYAQIFNGLLASLQQSEKSEDAQTVNGKMSFAVAGGGIDSKSVTSNARLENISPHDTIFIDVLKHLTPFYKTDLESVSAGDVVFAKGSLYIIDNEMLKINFEAIGVKTIESLPQFKTDKRLGKMIISYMSKIIDYPKKDSKYVLVSSEGKTITGIVKTDNLDDSAASTIMRFGPFPMQPICLVGIVEDGPAKEASLAHNPFPSSSMDYMSIETSKLIFSTIGRTTGELSVKPLAIFRQINASE